MAFHHVTLCFKLFHWCPRSWFYLSLLAIGANTISSAIVYSCLVWNFSHAISFSAALLGCYLSLVAYPDTAFTSRDERVLLRNIVVGIILCSALISVYISSDYTQVPSIFYSLMSRSHFRNCRTFLALSMRLHCYHSL